MLCFFFSLSLCVLRWSVFSHRPVFLPPQQEFGARNVLLHRITYCTADRRHPKVFAWVYRHQVKNKAVVLRCHAVLVPKAATARAMALLLFQTSASAFDEFKRLKRQNDGRRLQQQLLPKSCWLNAEIWAKSTPEALQGLPRHCGAVLGGSISPPPRLETLRPFLGGPRTLW